MHFNRIWVLHISMYYFYTAYNSQNIYKRYNGGPPTPAMIWSATALGGAVATFIMIGATLAEFTVVPTTWHNASHLTTRLLFLLATLAITAGPTVWIVLIDAGRTLNSIPLIIGIVQFFVSISVTALFGLMPSGRMFGDRVSGKSRKYLASQTFTASYPILAKSPRTASFALWILIFGCKFTESYFFLTLSFKNPILVMVGMRIQNCTDRFFGNTLCVNQAAFTLALMYIMDLCLFFLDTFLWYVIWNSVFSIGHSFSLGLSIWTPWNEVYTRLPKRIYAKILSTGELDHKYKPKVKFNCSFSACRLSVVQCRDLGPRLASLECHSHFDVS
jgi:1,3-beta-glucan synthase